MSTGHWIVRVSGHRHVAFCHCPHHQPIGAWSHHQLIEKIRRLP